MTAEIAFTRVRMPFGWLGNMSPHPITMDGVVWRTNEHAFQALRLPPGELRHMVGRVPSPMGAKMAAKLLRQHWVVEPRGEQDLANMRLVLRLKVEQYPHLGRLLVDTGDAWIIEDVSRRPTESGLFWGAVRSLTEPGRWRGENTLGLLWMELRRELRNNPVAMGV